MPWATYNLAIEYLASASPTSPTTTSCIPHTHPSPLPPHPPPPPPTPNATHQACYSLGYNLAIEYLADYEKTWMLDSFRDLNSRIINRDIDWVFLEVCQEEGLTALTGRV